MAKLKSDLVDEINEKLDAIEAGQIPCQIAVFHRTIQSYGANGTIGEPETALYSTGAKPSRTAIMFYTPHGLICKQRYGTTVVPLANVCYVRVL